MTVLVIDLDDVIIFAELRMSPQNDVTMPNIVKSCRYLPNTYYDQIGETQLNL